jgi:hypothetical protein
MIYELRIYRVMNGRMADLLTRFEHHTVPIMVRHGFLQVGFWTTIVGRSEQHLTYLLAWESLAQRQEKWDETNELLSSQMTSHRLSFCNSLIIALLLQGLINRYGPALFRLAMQHH